MTQGSAVVQYERIFSMTAKPKFGIETLTASFSAKKIQQLKRQDRALQLRMQGKELEEIRAELNLPSVRTVAYMVKKALRRSSFTDAEDLRLLEERKLDKLEREMIRIVMNDRQVYRRDAEGRVMLDSEGQPMLMYSKSGQPVLEERTTARIAAAEVMLKLSQRRADLRGLDAPSKVAQTDAAGNDIAAGAAKALDQQTLESLAKAIVGQVDARQALRDRMTEIHERKQAEQGPAVMDAEVVDES